MSKKKLKVLLNWASVPLVGYNYFRGINNLVDATIVTHLRNKQAVEKRPEYEKFFSMEAGKLSKQYYKMVEKFTANGRVNWPLYNAIYKAFIYPMYEKFDQQVSQKLPEKILNGDYDIVHAITQIMPPYPCKVVTVCQPTPFILGPVNGASPFHPGFKKRPDKNVFNSTF